MSELVEWIAAGIALLAAAAAFWQAFEARAARRDAQSASTSAAAHEAAALATAERLTTASEQTATATQGISDSGERTAVALAEIARRQPPWKLEPINLRTGEYKLINESTHAVITHRIVGDTEEDSRWLEGDGWLRNVPKEWSAHDWERLRNEGKGRLTAKSELTILVFWNWIDEPRDASEIRWKGIIA